MKNMWRIRIDERNGEQSYDFTVYVRAYDEDSVRIYAQEVLEEFYATDDDEDYHDFDGTWVFSPDSTRMAKIDGIDKLDEQFVIEVARDLATGKNIYLGIREVV